MKVVDHQEIYTVEFTKTEMEAINELSCDNGIYAMVKYGKMYQDDPRVEAASEINRITTEVLYGNK